MPKDASASGGESSRATQIYMEEKISIITDLLSRFTWQIIVAGIGGVFSIFCLIYNEYYIFYGFITFVFGIFAHILFLLLDWVGIETKKRCFFYLEHVSNLLLSIAWILTMIYFYSSYGS